MFFRILFLILFLSLNLIARGQDLEEGLRQLNSGQPQEAHETILRFFSENNQSGLANFYLARLDRQGEHSLAYLQDAIALLGDEKESESARIILAQYNYSQGLFISASEVLSRFKKEYPASQFMPQALYLLGTCYLASHQISLAKREFELILSSFGNSDLAPWARLGLGDCHYALENYGSAAAEYQKALDQYGSSEVAPLLLSQLSRCYNELRDNSRAYLYYNLLTDKYPAGAILPEVPLKETKSRSGAEQMVDLTYTVQLGVFGSQSAVSSLVGELKSKGYQPRTFAKAVDQKKYTVVQAGSYRSLEEAKQAKEKLEKELGGSYRVVIKE